MAVFLHHPILLYGIFLSIPLVSSCLRTTNNAGGDFLPDSRSSAKTFTTTPLSSSGSKEDVSKENGSGESTLQMSTSSSTSTSSPTTTEKTKHSGGHHGHHKGSHSHSHSHSQEEKFKKHMEQYREAGGDTRLIRRNESESSGGVSLHKPDLSAEKKDSKPIFESKDGGPGMCSSCPQIMIKTTEQLKQQCQNWQSINDNFYMRMDSDAPEIKEKYTFSECFKTVTCKEPHAIIRWLDYSMCDVHSSSKDQPEFELKCNGTHWTMHGFPVDAVTCAKRHRF